MSQTDRQTRTLYDQRQAIDTTAAIDRDEI